MTKSAKQILLDAADLLEKPGAWCQYSFALNSSDRYENWDSKYACKWCMSGAILKASRNASGATIRGIREMLCAFLGVNDISRWNDMDGRTQVECVAKLREAAEIAE